ncbi:MAG: metallopeptidase family protein [Puniceicoccaceae bacterium]
MAADRSARGLAATAEKVVEAAIGELPEEIRSLAEAIPVLLFEEVPRHLIEDGWEPDLLGFFEGGDLGAEDEPGQARILLFLGNLMDFAENDPETFREELRITFLHELGHLLGLDEEDLDVRGLG